MELATPVQRRRRTRHGFPQRLGGPTLEHGLGSEIPTRTRGPDNG